MSKYDIQEPDEQLIELIKTLLEKDANTDAEYRDLLQGGIATKTLHEHPEVSKTQTTISDHLAEFVERGELRKVDGVDPETAKKARPSYLPVGWDDE